MSDDNKTQPRRWPRRTAATPRLENLAQATSQSTSEPELSPPAGVAQIAQAERLTVATAAALTRLRALRGGADAWSPDALSQLERLAAREGELDLIDQDTAAGRVVDAATARRREILERSIQRARRGLSLGTTQGAAMRHGRAAARRATVDALGLELMDGLPTLLAGFAADPQQLLARPLGHDCAAEEAMRVAMIAARQITPGGDPVPGSRWAVLIGAQS